MNKEVYKFIFRTYGHNLEQWIGFFAEVFRIAVMRVYMAIAIAQVTANVASGNFDAAKKYTLYFFFAYLAAAIIGTLGEILSNYTESKQYAKLSVAFYQKLVGKDVSFYRDNQTGYLASMFRQHLDASMLLLRFFRGEALGSFIALVVPPIVLFFASPQVGLIAATIVLIQFIYVTWSSSKVNKYRRLSHEIYREVTGEVSDVITNIIAFKSGGVEDKARSRMDGLAQHEASSFEIRRRTAALLDLPRNIITACGITTAVYFIVSKSSGADPQSLGLIVLTLTYMFQMIRSVDILPSLIASHDDLVTKAYPTLDYLSEKYETIRNPANPLKLSIKKGAISIDKVNFSYHSRSHKNKRISVFKNLTIKIKGGEQVGIVGLSGAGKSTLASLLLRFDEINSGSIKIDGIDIRDVKQSELRQKIAYVPQEPLLFHRNIKENIAYYNY
ncbi:MAG: ABC transporter ATP-binding protein, partial [bacterium]|nr:ABC transporter ATP-binding protein [bacterium]